MINEVCRGTWTGESIILCYIKSGWQKEPQHVVKYAIVHVSESMTMCTFGLVDNCISLFVQVGIYWRLNCLPTAISNVISYKHGRSLAGALGYLNSQHYTLIFLGIFTYSTILQEHVS